MKVQLITAAVLAFVLFSCKSSADHFPAGNETKKEYTKDQREQYDVPKEKKNLEDKAERTTELDQAE